MSLSKFHKQLILNRIFLLEKKGRLKIKRDNYSHTYSISVPKVENSLQSQTILFIVKRTESGSYKLITPTLKLNLKQFTPKEQSHLLKGKILSLKNKLYCIHKTMNAVLSISKNTLKTFLSQEIIQLNKNIKLNYTYNKVLSSAQIEDMSMGKNITLELNVYNSQNILQGTITKTVTADPSFFRGVNSFNTKTPYLRNLKEQHKRNESV